MLPSFLLDGCLKRCNPYWVGTGSVASPSLINKSYLFFFLDNNRRQFWCETGRCRRRFSICYRHSHSVWRGKGGLYNQKNLTKLFFDNGKKLISLLESLIFTSTWMGIISLEWNLSVFFHYWTVIVSFKLRERDAIRK